MKRDDVIRLAREAEIIDFRDESDDPHVAQMVEFLERFAALVAAMEREECAKLCDQFHAVRATCGFPREASAFQQAAGSIRYRGAA